MRPSSFELTTASPQMILYNRMYLNKEMRAFSAALSSLRRSHANLPRLCAARCTPASAVHVPLSRHSTLCRAPAFPVHVPLSRLESLFDDAHLRQSASAKSELTKLMDIIRDKM